MSRQFPQLIVIAGLSLWLTHFSGGQNLEVLGEYKIGVVGRDWSQPVYQAFHVGAQDAAKQLAKQYSVDIELLIKSPSEHTVPDEIEALGELLAAGVDGIAISVADDEATVPLLQFAHSEGIALTLFERSIESVPALYTVRMDNFAAGKMIAESIQGSLGRLDEIAILVGNGESDALRDRLRGIRSVIPNRKIYGTFDCEPTFESASSVVQGVTQRDYNGRIGAWLFLDDWPLRGMTQLPWEPGRIRCASVQSSATALVYVRTGFVDALACFEYYDWGQRSITYLVDFLQDGTRPEPATRTDKPYLVTRDNVEANIEAWGKWLN